MLVVNVKSNWCLPNTFWKIYEFSVIFRSMELFWTLRKTQHHRHPGWNTSRKTHLSYRKYKNISPQMEPTSGTASTVITCFGEHGKTHLESPRILMIHDNNFQDENCRDVKRGELSSGFYLNKLTFNRLSEPSKTCWNTVPTAWSQIFATLWGI